MVEKSNQKKICFRCGYEWSNLADKPKACPFCKSYRWNVPPVKNLDNPGVMAE